MHGLKKEVESGLDAGRPAMILKYLDNLKHSLTRSRSRSDSIVMSPLKELSKSTVKKTSKKSGLRQKAQSFLVVKEKIRDPYSSA